MSVLIDIIYVGIVLLWNLLLSYHDHIQQSLVSRTGGNDRKWKPQKPSGNYRLLRNYKSTRIQRWPHFRQSTLLLWSLETETLRIHSFFFYINQRCFLQHLEESNMDSGGFHFKIPRSGSEGWMHIPFFCPSLVQWSFLADIWLEIEKHKHYIGHICLCGTKSENFPLLKRIHIISIHIYNKIIV